MIRHRVIKISCMATPSFYSFTVAIIVRTFAMVSVPGISATGLLSILLRIRLLPRLLGSLFSVRVRHPFVSSSYTVSLRPVVVNVVAFILITTTAPVTSKVFATLIPVSFFSLGTASADVTTTTTSVVASFAFIPVPTPFRPSLLQVTTFALPLSVQPSFFFRRRSTIEFDVHVRIVVNRLSVLRVSGPAAAAIFSVSRCMIIIRRAEWRAAVVVTVIATIIGTALAVRHTTR
mmetsp:Transcript_23533/g.40649  ORF Transcript_23533/g.40649 Transcript_23533/m.40649 type:complete len:233 (-) Transcript_23533:51-749(-)